MSPKTIGQVAREHGTTIDAVHRAMRRHRIKPDGYVDGLAVVNTDTEAEILCHLDKDNATDRSDDDMSLLEAFRDLYGKRTVKTRGDKTALWAKYRELLDRRNEPKRGDPKALLEVCEQLDLTPAHVELHVAVLEEAAALAVEADQVETVAADVTSADTRLADARAELMKAQTKVATASTVATGAREKLTRVTAIAESSEGLRRYFGPLFGQDLGDVSGQGGLYLPPQSLHSLMTAAGMPVVRIGELERDDSADNLDAVELDAAPESDTSDAPQDVASVAGE